MSSSPRLDALEVEAPPSMWPVCVSGAMRSVIANARDVAETDTTVLLTGGSGSGKNLLARFIHDQSLRARRPFVSVACAIEAIEGALERELFAADGPLERASGGTLVLDEVGELPTPLQAKLLRLLQDRQLSEGRPSTFDVRIIATTSRDLRLAVGAGRFRADLFYRLCVFPIALPALRERPGDIEALAERFVAGFARRLGRPTPTLSTTARAALSAHDYAGNVRELRNVIERAAIRCRKPLIEAADLVFDPPLPNLDRTEETLPAIAVGSEWELPIDLGELERLAVSEALRRVGGNRTHAARLLGISLRTLRNKLKAWRESGSPLRGADETRCHEGDASVARSSQNTAEEQAA